MGNDARDFRLWQPCQDRLTRGGRMSGICSVGLIGPGPDRKLRFELRQCHKRMPLQGREVDALERRLIQRPQMRHGDIDQAELLQPLVGQLGDF